MNIQDLMITSLETISLYDILTGAHKFTLDELQSASIAQGEERSDITGKQGRKLGTLKRNKTVTIEGTNGMVSGGLLEIQVGGKFENKKTLVKWRETVVVNSNAAATSFVAAGAVGDEINSVEVKNASGLVVKTMTQGAEVGEGVFTYNPETKALAFNAGEIADGTEIAVHYNRQVMGDVLSNMSDSYSDKGVAFIDCFAEDKCANLYRVQMDVPKADFHGEFTLELGGDQTVHSFTIDALAGACGTSGALWNYTVIGVDAEDVA